MSHDTDKLIRQLSLVAFLMAERRPITARDVKGNVEGYSEMSDEAFARRFYSDRSELVSLGVPLESQRDEFTGEELYTLRSEQYFLPALELSDDELAALQTCLYLLEGQFAYAEPLRLALQNLALGRPAPRDLGTDSAVRVNVLGTDYSAEMPGRLTKLEAAISKGRTVKFDYWTISRDEMRERTVNPYALFSDNGVWYVVGHDVDRGGERMFRVSRIRGDIRFATRRERDFRPPASFDPSIYRGRPTWQIGETAGEARVEVAPDTAWWVARAFADRGELADGVFTTPYADLRQLAAWILRQDGRARALEPPELVDQVARALELVAARHEAPPPDPAPEVEPEDGAAPPERSAGPVAPERFALLQALLAYLLARCGDEPRITIPADELSQRFRLTREQLEEHLSLLNLVNFGGGCYALYATLADTDVHVEKELFGETFRRPPRLTPLEARAIRLALEFVGPMIAAEAHTPLERVRRKLEETFGQFELRETPAPVVGPEEELIRTLSDAIAERRLVEIEYLPVGEETSVRTVEPYSLERRLPYWYVHTWDRTRDGERSFRVDRMRRARVLDDRFEQRPGFDPRELRGARTARVWFSPEVARWRLERGTARRLADGAALEDISVG
ncbi:MAG: WYL domain-containing protein, partial [Actinomycetota bacterium]|nr:WYL domain-containing protein [Actinomycetota bacterium]